MYFFMIALRPGVFVAKNQHFLAQTCLHQAEAQKHRS